MFDEKHGAGVGVDEEGRRVQEPDVGERFAGFGFGRQGEKKAGLKGFLISRPLESLPKYAPGSRA